MFRIVSMGLLAFFLTSVRAEARDLTTTWTRTLQARRTCPSPDMIRRAPVPTHVATADRVLEVKTVGARRRAVRQQRRRPCCAPVYPLYSLRAAHQEDSDCRYAIIGTLNATTSLWVHLNCATNNTVHSLYEPTNSPACHCQYGHCQPTQSCASSLLDRPYTPMSPLECGADQAEMDRRVQTKFQNSALSYKACYTINVNVGSGPLIHSQIICVTIPLPNSTSRAEIWFAYEITGEANEPDTLSGTLEAGRYITIPQDELTRLNIPLTSLTVIVNGFVAPREGVASSS